ncbi:MAG: hypothetical protein IJB96_03140 [Lachnospira sp.]|nr:hypothetical protein [Lachnospira sp.]
MEMTELEVNCYNFMKELTEELSEEFEGQYERMESFARWNLPDEIGMEWIDAEGMIDILEKSNSVSKDLTKKFREIVSRFELEFKNSDSEAWTFEGMKSGEFWSEQRRRAREILQEMSSVSC